MVALMNQGEAFLKANMVVLDPMATKPIASLSAHPNVQWDSNGSTDSVLLKDWKRDKRVLRKPLLAVRMKMILMYLKHLLGGR